MKNEERKALHDRYLRGESSPAELNEFLDTFGEGEVQDMADVEDVFNASPVKWVPSKNIADEILRKGNGGKIRRLYIFRAVAAVIALVLLFGGAFQAYQYVHQQDEMKDMLTFTVPVGQVKELTLTDGSKVTLAPGSVFKYPEVFKGKERRVYLSEGRAFFKVSHDASRPFTVKSGTLSTTALGTSFMVQSYSRYDFEKVSLYTGKVKVEDGIAQHQQVILHPGHSYDYHVKEGKGNLEEFPLTSDPLKDGMLVYEQSSLSEVLYSLSSYYGASISFKTAQLNKDINFSGKFSKGGTLEEALNSLAFIYKFKFKKTAANDYIITD